MLVGATSGINNASNSSGSFACLSQPGIWQFERNAGPVLHENAVIPKKILGFKGILTGLNGTILLSPQP